MFYPVFFKRIHCSRLDLMFCVVNVIIICDIIPLRPQKYMPRRQPVLASTQWFSSNTNVDFINFFLSFFETKQARGHLHLTRTECRFFKTDFHLELFSVTVSKDDKLQLKKSKNHSADQWFRKRSHGVQRDGSMANGAMAMDAHARVCVMEEAWHEAVPGVHALASFPQRVRLGSSQPLKRQRSMEYLPGDWICKSRPAHSLTVPSFPNFTLTPPPIDHSSWVSLLPHQNQHQHQLAQSIVQITDLPFPVGFIGECHSCMYSITARG